MEALTRRLQVSSQNILPAYEDAFYYLWKETASSGQRGRGGFEARQCARA